MDVQLVPTQGFRKDHLAQRLARTGPDVPQRAEERTHVDSRIGLGAVIGRHVGWRQAGLQPFQVDPSTGFRQRAARGHAALHVSGPLRLGVLAEYLEATRRFLLRGVEHDLHRAARVARRVVGLLLRKDQRVVQLHVLHDDRATPLGQRRRGRHSAVERARRHQPAEDLVVVQPSRIGRVDFRLIRGLAASGLVPDTEQRVLVALASPPRQLDPVPLALKRITRQRYSAAGLPCEETFEGDIQPGRVGFRHRIDEAAFRLRRGRVPGRSPQGCEHNRVFVRHPARRRSRPSQGRHRAQHGVRANLHNEINPQCRQRLDAASECHRLTGMPTPVRRIQRLTGRHRPARDIAHQVERWRHDLHTCQRGFHAIECRLDQGAVEGLAGVQPPHANLFRLEAVHDGFNGGHRAADDLMRPVVRCDAEPDAARCRVDVAHRRSYSRCRRENGGHGARSGQGCKRRAAPRHKAHAVLEVEHARRLRCRQLSQAVAHRQAGPDSHAGPQRGQGALQRIDRWLRPGRVVQVALGAGTSEHHVKQRGASLVAKYRLAAVQHLSYHRLTRVQVRAHPDPLAALAGVDERHLSRRRLPGLVRGLRQRPQSVPQRSGIVEGQACAGREVAAPNACRPGHVGEQFVRRCIRGRKRFGPLIEPGGVAPRQVPQGLVRLSRQRQQSGRTRIHCPRHRSVRHRLHWRQRDRPRRTQGPRPCVETIGCSLRPSVAFDHDMRVGSRPPKAAHPSERVAIAVARPSRWFRRHLQRQALPVDRRRRIPEVQVLGDQPLIHRQQHFDQAGGSRGWLEVAQVCLDRSDQQRTIRLALFPIGRGRCP